MSRERPGPNCPWARCSAANGSGSAATQPPTTASTEAVHHFPYAILEIKLQDGDSCPDWVLVSRLGGWAVGRLGGWVVGRLVGQEGGWVGTGVQG